MNTSGTIVELPQATKLEQMWYHRSIWEHYLSWLVHNDTETLERELFYLRKIPPLDTLVDQYGQTEDPFRNTSLWYQQKKVGNLLMRCQLEGVSCEEYEHLLHEIYHLMDYSEQRFWVLLTLARLHFLTKDYEAAVDLCHEILRNNPGHADTWLLLARLSDFTNQDLRSDVAWTQYYTLRPFYTPPGFKRSEEPTQALLSGGRPPTDLTILLLAKKVPGDARVLVEGEVMDVRCRMCGKCCRIAQPLTEGEVRDISLRTQVPAEQFARKVVEKREGRQMTLRKRASGYCYWFSEQTNKCTIYEHRPESCRNYPYQQVVVDGRSYTILNLCRGVEYASAAEKEVSMTVGHIHQPFIGRAGLS